jgi:hypothetical protein
MVARGSWLQNYEGCKDVIDRPREFIQALCSPERVDTLLGRRTADEPVFAAMQVRMSFAEARDAVQPLSRNIPSSVTLLLCKIPQFHEVTRVLEQCSNQRVYAVRSPRL